MDMATVTKVRSPGGVVPFFFLFFFFDCLTLFREKVLASFCLLVGKPINHEYVLVVNTINVRCVLVCLHVILTNRVQRGVFSGLR